MAPTVTVNNTKMSMFSQFYKYCCKTWCGEANSLHKQALTESDTLILLVKIHFSSCLVIIKWNKILKIDLPLRWILCRANINLRYCAYFSFDSDALQLFSSWFDSSRTRQCLTIQLQVTNTVLSWEPEDGCWNINNSTHFLVTIPWHIMFSLESALSSWAGQHSSTEHSWISDTWNWKYWKGVSASDFSLLHFLYTFIYISFIWVWWYAEVDDSPWDEYLFVPAEAGRHPLTLIWRLVFIFDILFLLSELKLFWKNYSGVRTTTDVRSP